jgi:hypothetical protein
MVHGPCAHQCRESPLTEEGKLLDLQVYSIFNTAVYSHVVLDEGERRKSFFCAGQLKSTLHKIRFDTKHDYLSSNGL